MQKHRMPQVVDVLVLRREVFSRSHRREEMSGVQRGELLDVLLGLETVLMVVNFAIEVHVILLLVVLILLAV